MKIPKYVDAALKRRTKLANQLMDACVIVDDFLDRNGIDPDCACWLTGVEIYVNPKSAELEVRRAIEKAEGGNHE